MGICGKAEMSKKTKIKQTFQTHGQGLGRGLAGDMGLGCFFVFPWFFVQFGLGGRRCANYKNVYFLRGIVMKISSYEQYIKTS